jgi:two-component system response regulator RegX3
VFATKGGALQVLINSSDILHARITRFLLEDVGYTVRHEVDEHGARRSLKQSTSDLILIDEECPEIGGYNLCSEVRAQYHTPIIFMGENCSVSNRVRALKMGADDVVQKPYNPNELLARIEAVMRRYGDEYLRLYTAYEPISVGTIHLDPVQRRVVVDGQREENLTEREFQLLYYMAQNARCVLSSRQLLQQIWGIEDATDSNLVPVYVGRLRRKIEKDPLNPAHIVRIRDMGYSFQP